MYTDQKYNNLDVCVCTRTDRLITVCETLRTTNSNLSPISVIASLALAAAVTEHCVGELLVAGKASV